MEEDNQLAEVPESEPDGANENTEVATFDATWPADDQGDSKGSELLDKIVDGTMDIGRSLAPGTSDGIAAIGKGAGSAIQSMGRGVEALLKTPAMVEGFRTHLKEVQTLSEERLQNLAAKCYAWEKTFTAEKQSRMIGLSEAHRLMDAAIQAGDKDLMLKALAGMITVLEKTDLVKASSILTSEWKGNSTPAVAMPAPKSLLEDNGEDFDSGL